MHITERVSPNLIGTAQVLEFSFCALQDSSPIWPEAMDAIQLTLGVLMCLLIAYQFIRQSLQMYRATRRFQPSRYMSLLTREGMLYFLAYVYIFHAIKQR